MNYEKKYKEALERAKGLLEDMDEGDYFASSGDIENIFPELKEKESEDKDEMIRQCLIEHIKCNKDLNWSLFQWFKPDTIIAWLEKQSEKKPAENVKALDADKVIAWMKNTIKQRAENYGVYKETHLILPYNSIEDLINDFKEDFGL